MPAIHPPSRIESLKELRTWQVFPKLAFNLPRLAVQDRGNGEPVMVVPGFCASDSSTAVLRNYLRYLGYTVSGWGLGTNSGNVPELLENLTQKVAAYAQEQNNPVRLIGWSLGGYISREVARDRPDLVDSVITLGSPVIGGPKYTAVAPFYRQMGHDVEEIAREVEARYDQPLEVPVTAIYSRGDGVVAWEACVDDRSPNMEHVEVSGSHLSLGFSPGVLRIIAKRLRTTH